ncbi:MULTISPECIES: hypothetical protein [Rhodopirellula]|uniref:hypothetical protein n=1 Tax=Rhodopirellula TaxID=265488 RepID=UPI00257F89C9|nr:hypothetical protein [Rhodopirellula sp. UBA1907]
MITATRIGSFFDSHIASSDAARDRSASSGPVACKAACWLLLLCVLLTSGCSDLYTKYGKTDGTIGNESLNGFGAFRDTLTEKLDETERAELGEDWEDAELRSRNLTRLSSRAYQHDAIVWVPTAWPPINPGDVSDWMTKWLRSGNRTVVFIVPDEGSTEAYWREASNLAPPEQRLEYRRRLAQQINLRLLEDVRRDDIIVGKLFTARGLPARQNIDDRRVVSYDLHDFDPKRDKTASVVTPGGLVVTAAKPNDATIVEGEDSEGEESELDETAVDEPTESSDSAEETNDEQDDSKQNSRPSQLFETLDEHNGITTFARITHPKWKDSRVLVVASGGMLTNFAMTDEPAIELAKQIRQEILSNAEVGADERVSFGFMTSDHDYVQISDAEPGAPAQTGMEMLTTWPISLVTLHALFLGVVMCLMLLPTFGRARQVVYHRSTHFGNHLSAMAILMRRAGGMNFAKEKINHYMRVVRGEPDLFVVPKAPPEPPQNTNAPPIAKTEGEPNSPDTSDVPPTASESPVATTSLDPPVPNEPAEKSP